MVKKREILLIFFLFTIVLATFPFSIVKIADNKNKEGYGDYQNAALKTSVWQSGFNYSIIDNYPYSWIEINETGTEFKTFALSNDDGVNTTSLTANGWNFTFYGTEYSYLNVSTNGWMTFWNQNDGWVYAWHGASEAYTWDNIPQNCNTATHENYNDTVILLGTDLVPYQNGQIFYQFFGNSPNRYLVVEYFEISEYTTYDNQTMEAIFYENGDIKFQYKSITDPMAGLGWDIPVAKVGLVHGDLINYSNYTNDWNATFGGAVNELAVYFRLSKSGAIYLPLGGDDDDDDDGEEAIPGFDLYLILLSSLLALIAIVKKFRKHNK